MKLKNFFIAILAIVGLTSVISCSEDFEPTFQDGLTVSQSYVALLENKNDSITSSTITVNAKADWSIEMDEATAKWLSISPMNGSAGSTDVKFSAKNYEGREASVKIVSGDKTQMINVIQGKATVKTATCAEVLDNNSPENKTYQLKGTVTSIANTTYGNWYLDDGTGKVYIYGTLDKNGATKNFTSLGIEVGDEVTVQGPKKVFNGTVELENVTVVKIEKSLIKVDSVDPEDATFPKEGGDITVQLDCKGYGVGVEVPEDAQDWLSIKKVNGNFVTFHATANAGGARETTVSFTTADGSKTYSADQVLIQEGAVQDVTCAQFNTLEDGAAEYKVHGVITSIASDLYGNVYINDGTGEVYVYGILDAEGNAKNFASLGLKVGDEVTLQSVKTSYKGAPQMKNAVVVSSIAHETKTAAELKALPDDTKTYYYVKGVVCHAEEEGTKFDLDTYGNFGLKDETGTIYVYGVADALDGATKNFKATGVQEGDIITILAYKTSYKGTNELVGKFIKKESAK